MNEKEKFAKRNALNAELAQLMSDLGEETSAIGDWKVIKIYEARLLGKEDPYNFEELAAKRQAARDRINEIQEELKKLDTETNNE